jgi:shikimate dehydrogenase
MLNERKPMKIRSVEDLIREGDLSFAREPKHNPGELNFPRYALTPIEHDYPGKSPVMWNHAYQKFGIDAGYVFMIGNPEKASVILEAFNADPKYIGGGAGVGFKDEVVKYIDLDPMAKAIGAINFIMKVDGKLRGYNTDGLGYAASLSAMFDGDLTDKRIVVLGAGGTGNAIAFALAGMKARVVILNRTVEKAKELADRINRFEGREAATYGGEDQIVKTVLNADAIVNVSTKGAVGPMEQYSALAPARLPATPENVAANLAEAAAILDRMSHTTIVSDVVLTKKPSPLLAAATQRGFKTLDGIPMVVNQGVEAFWMLHGQELRTKGITKGELAEAMKEAANT